MKKVYISPAIEMTDMPYEDHILTVSSDPTGTRASWGYDTALLVDPDEDQIGIPAVEGDDIYSLSKGNNMYLTYDDEW